MYVPSQLLDCECDLCSEGDCSIDLTGRTQSIHVLDLNCVKARSRASGRIADCAILWKDKNIFAIVELKGGQNAVTIDRAVEQIQHGIDIIYRYVGNDQRVEDFYPILMYKGRDPTRALADKRVTLRKIDRRIVPKKCGSRLSDII